MMRYLVVCVALLTGCSSDISPSLPDGKNRVVDIVNTSNVPLAFSAVNAEQRGLNRLPTAEGTVPANYYLTINFDDGTGACIFNLRAEFSDGRVAEAKKFDTCAVVSWVVGQTGSVGG